jgi:hypothetical protein
MMIVIISPGTKFIHVDANPNSKYIHSELLTGVHYTFSMIAIDLMEFILMY